MRNLRNIRNVTLNPPENSVLSRCSWDVLTDDVIFASGPSEENCAIELRRCSFQAEDGAKDVHSELIAAWDAPCPIPDLTHDRVVDTQYFADDSTTVLILAGGDIVVVRQLPADGEEKIEIVGSIDTSIEAAAWSPDEELVAICTKGNTLLFMTRQFESVVSIDILGKDLNASKHVSVGWGKSETQFKGKGAKALRDPTMPEKVEEGLRSDQDDQASTISWRGDGQYVALNSLQNSHRRVVRIYSREGALDGVTEPVDYLEGALSWRPAGNLLAGVQRFADQAKVVFFERNGLRHGEFSLRLNSEASTSWASSIQLSWNVDSTVLAVIFRDRVQLWTMGNYHYYLKIELLIPHDSPSDTLFLRWHPERPLLFATGRSGPKAIIKVLEYRFAVSRGALNLPYDNGAVAVIDGGILKLTSMKYANIPPPMAGHDVVLGKAIIDCAMKSVKPQKIRVAALTRSTIYVVDWIVDGLSEVPVICAQKPYQESDLAHVQDTNGISAMQISFDGPDKVVLLCAQGVETTTSILNIDEQKGWGGTLGQFPQIREIAQNSEKDQDGFYLGFLNGSILLRPRAMDQFRQFKSKQPTKHLSQWDSFDVIHTNRVHPGQVNGTQDEEPICVSLAKNGQLSADDRVLVNNCTSYLVTHDHIIFTTFKHLLKFVHVDKVDRLEVPPDTPEADERCRSIERGARLITVIPSRSALVLQMPRGNLETIYPRALVLADIRRAINQKQYRKAFLACRSHRVDMNILHDHKPSPFLKDIPIFIDQVKKVEHLDLFLSQLRDEDCSVTMYKETSKEGVEMESSNRVASEKLALTTRNGESKVNRICIEFIQSLRPLGASYLQSLITAHVCKNPPDLISGLKEVSKLQAEGSAAMESAMEHICFLVDVNRLYDAALGLYDLKLALLVAQQSQKDPREYIPFLNNLHVQSPLRMRYSIDNHLGRTRLCLEHLKGLDAFEELKVYMAKHELYQEAIELYKYQEERVSELMQLHAEYLSGKSRHKDAAIAFEYLGEYERACEAYHLANLWREALTSAYAADYSEERIKDLARSLSTGLIESKDFASAAIIAYEHLNDVEAATRLFCKAHLFANAARLLRANKRNDLLEKVLDTGLIEGMGTMIELLADCKAQLLAQVPRIRELRIKKAQEPLSFYDAAANDGADIPDNVSLAATDASTAGGTLFTRYTNRTGTVGTNTTRRTSKNRRREERKRAMGKKGSVYEEEYLVNSVARLIEKVNSEHDDAGRLVMGLMQRRMRERAKAVQDAMTAVIDLCKECIPEVFQEEEELQPKQEAPPGADGVQWESIEALRQKPRTPVLKSFARLSLVGGDP